MKKLFVSVPMKYRTDEEIKDSISKMKKIAEVFEGEELELIPSYTKYEVPEGSKESIFYLNKSIEKLAEADVFIGIHDAYYTTGCYIERIIAEKYGVKSYFVDVSSLIPNWSELLLKIENTHTADVPC